MDFKKLIESKDYDFLRNNEHLGNNMIFLTVGGSHAYGTSVEGSDVDIRGCTLNSRKELIGISKFEQVEDKKTDTVVYGFNKFIKLILNCNPNTIELLGCKPEHYFLMNDIGKSLIENKKMFLSKRAVYSFGGYAGQQLTRLENYMARDGHTGGLKKKDNASLNKHAMHLIRLYLMCIDILEKEEINTYRKNDRELLLSIRRGDYQKSDGTYCDEFSDMVNELENKVQYAKENTSLPERPNYTEVEDFVMSINEMVVIGNH